MPLVVATGARSAEGALLPAVEYAPDGVARPLGLSLGTAAGLIASLTTEPRAVLEADATMPDALTWAASPYHPTPTIVEAARALY